MYDGGDVVWLGDCEWEYDDEVPLVQTHPTQDLFIYGTGRDPENFVVVMDFWLDGAKPWNRICPRPSKHQALNAAAECADPPEGEELCLRAADLFSPGTAANTLDGDSPGGVRGPGCKHDGGPLWISIPLEDDPVVALAGGGATYAHTIWARFYQRAPKKEKVRAHPEVAHTNRHPATYPYYRYDSHGRDSLSDYHPRTWRDSYVSSWNYAQVDSYVEDDLVECLAIAVCTTTGGAPAEN